jgi:hypothetical protein
VAGIVVYAICNQFAIYMQDYIVFEGRLNSIVLLAVCTPIVLILLMICACLANISEVIGLFGTARNKLLGEPAVLEKKK